MPENLLLRESDVLDVLDMLDKDRGYGDVNKAFCKLRDMVIDVYDRREARAKSNAEFVERRRNRNAMSN